MDTRQVSLEREMREEGIHRFHKNNLQKAEKAQESTTTYGQYLLRQTVLKVEEAINEHIESSMKGRSGSQLHQQSC